MRMQRIKRSKKTGAAICNEEEDCAKEPLQDAHVKSTKVIKYRRR